jgi:hypothetical protein
MISSKRAVEHSLCRQPAGGFRPDARITRPAHGSRTVDGRGTLSGHAHVPASAPNDGYQTAASCCGFRPDARITRPAHGSRTVDGRGTLLMSQPRPQIMATRQSHPAVGPLGGMPPAVGQFSNQLGPASVSLPRDLNRPNSSKEQLRVAN